MMAADKIYFFFMFSHIGREPELWDPVVIPQLLDFIQKSCFLNVLHHVSLSVPKAPIGMYMIKYCLWPNRVFVC